MGSLVEYRCAACAFATSQLAIGWGKTGRASYWGGLARCDICKELTVVDLAGTRPGSRDFKCLHCQGLLKLLDGTSEGLHCPGCGSALAHTAVGSWA